MEADVLGVVEVRQHGEARLVVLERGPVHGSAGGRHVEADIRVRGSRPEEGAEELRTERDPIEYCSASDSAGFNAWKASMPEVWTGVEKSLVVRALQNLA